MSKGLCLGTTTRRETQTRASACAYTCVGHLSPSLPPTTPEASNDTENRQVRPSSAFRKDRLLNGNRPFVHAPLSSSSTQSPTPQAGTGQSVTKQSSMDPDSGVVVIGPDHCGGTSRPLPEASLSVLFVVDHPRSGPEDQPPFRFWVRVLGPPPVGGSRSCWAFGRVPSHFPPPLHSRRTDSTSSSLLDERSTVLDTSPSL